MSKYSRLVKKNSWRKIAGIVIALVLLLVATTVFIAHRVYDVNLQPVAANQKTMTITIPRGYSLKQIASLFKDRGIIRSDWAFSQYVRNQQADNDIQAGTYDLSPSQSVPEIVSIITEGKIKTDLITILPGQRLDQIRKTFINSGFSAASVDAALNPDLYKDHPALVDKPAGASLEGYLYPDSFQKTADTTPQIIIQQSLDLMQKQLTPDIRNAFVAQGLSVHQGVTLASMVEQEANKPADRNQVAQVFLTRLHSGIRLESDVTAFYGATLAGQPKSVNYDSLYNTYLHDGLPTGPISNVSASSLQAVAHPASGSYLYFIAGDNGTVYYSQTLQEHDAQITQYCHTACGQ
ncbi:MAG TPA: endolytic transglycosylase MltG [Patescibacteria group bacterium]|nr:endolytic transglycosylase MltG [Patescibacteria group bacterium]